MSLEFVINGEASVGAWEKPGSLQLHAPNGGNLTVDGPLGGAFLIPRPLAVVDYSVCGFKVSLQVFLLLEFDLARFAGLR